MVLSEHSIKLKIGKIFRNEKLFEEQYVKISEIDPQFSKNCKEKIKVDKSRHEYKPFRIDINFSEYGLALENDEKGQQSH